MDVFYFEQNALLGKHRRIRIQGEKRRETKKSAYTAIYTNIYFQNLFHILKMRHMKCRNRTKKTKENFGNGCLLNFKMAPRWIITSRLYFTLNNKRRRTFSRMLPPEHHYYPLLYRLLLINNTRGIVFVNDDVDQRKVNDGPTTWIVLRIKKR